MTSSSTTASGMGGMGGMGTGGAGGGNQCLVDCMNNNMAAFQKFEGYELKECGCAMGSPCATECMTFCPSTVPMMNDPCGMCLLAEAAKQMSSPCTVAAGLNDCSMDMTCAPFVTCVLGC